MNLAAAAQSSVGRKLISGFTGLLLVVFVIGHLTGNFLLLAGPMAFNDYAYFLETLFHGVGLILAEIGLILVFGFHAWSGLSVWQNKARKDKYVNPGDAGGVSRKSLSSVSMLYTGILLLLFVCWHVAQFKFGVIDAQADERYRVVNGLVIRDLYGLVVDSFGQPVWALTYIVIMAGLGFHLWHGAWSAFQSLGLANDKYLPTLTSVAHVVAVVLAIGFLFLPAFILVQNDHFQELDQRYLSAYPQATQTNMEGFQLGE